jgi:hypothetical protein
VVVTVKINERGFWENNTTEGHGHDESLARGIADFLADENCIYEKEQRFYPTVVDLGAGTGFYTKFLTEEGFYCVAVDGNPFSMEISNGIVIPLDLTLDHKELFRELWDKSLECEEWGICLEVGEHIPKEFEQNFLDNICFLSRKGIILSWAVPGQGGDGHVNCQPNSYIIGEMAKRGYELDVMSSDILRGSASKYPNTGYWFKATIMVFKK